ncbi:MAG TPA: hypothetical protein VGB68_07310 [Pyrinomonadaceae bacterium]|jgi:hypothetical protein
MNNEQPTMNNERFTKEICPRCEASLLKEWRDLTDEQKFLVERLPLNTEFPPAERKKHLYCPRCWHEVPNAETRA